VPQSHHSSSIRFVLPPLSTDGADLSGFVTPPWGSIVANHFSERTGTSKRHRSVTTDGIPAP